MNATKNIQIFQRLEDLNAAAAAFIVKLAKEAVATRGKFVISLSGGQSPNEIYAMLASLPFSEQMPWHRTHIFWGDERFVPFDDERNNAFNAKSIMLSKISIPASNIYPIPVNLNPVEAARKYEQELITFFGEAPSFDLIMLGLGENGHTASLFPNSPVLNEKLPGIREVWIAEENMMRITMTAPLINLARNILFIVTGENKAAILKTVLTSPFCPEKYPAQLIKPIDGELVWFVDKGAAGNLDNT